MSRLFSSQTIRGAGEFCMNNSLPHSRITLKCKNEHERLSVIDARRIVEYHTKALVRRVGDSTNRRMSKKSVVP